MRKIHLQVSLCICVLFILPTDSFHGQQSPRDWSAEYDKLAQRVYAKEGQPRGGPKSKEPYLYWMEEKEKDRDEIKKLYLEVLDLSNVDRESQAIADWITKFQKLLDLAQESGNYTARLGATMLLRIDYRFGGDNWGDALFKLKEEGRPLYNKASETEFANDYIRDYARCLANYAVKDVEIGKMGLYRGRERLGGTIDPEGILVPPTRDFVADCERRAEFQTIEKGEPGIPADIGLKWVERIRDECDWWQFGKERADATDLMVEFYKDVLCKDPPKKGHKWYLDEAKKYKLDDAIDHNEGFYATIYGKVEILTDEGKKPAPGAKVRVYAPLDDQEWTTTADGDGEYKIKYVILHKDCSPFDISAEYKGDKEETEFDGPLEEPDQSYEFEKDLLIKPEGWEGTIESTGTTVTKGDESLLGVLLGKGEAERQLSWNLDVVFKLDRGNERVRIYELKSAKFSYSDTTEGEFKLETQVGKVRSGGSWLAKVEDRNLSPSECDLELIIDLKKKTYKIEGILYVKNITEEVKGEVEVDMSPIHGGEKDTGDQKIEYREEILIEGKFSEDNPDTLEGSLDENDEIPPEFMEFMESFVGKISGKTRWKLERKGKH